MGSKETAPRNLWEQCSLVRAVGYLGMTGMKTIVSLMCY